MDLTRRNHELPGLSRSARTTKVHGIGAEDVPVRGSDHISDLSCRLCVSKQILCEFIIWCLDSVGVPTLAIEFHQLAMGPKFVLHPNYKVVSLFATFKLDVHPNNPARGRFQMRKFAMNKYLFVSFLSLLNLVSGDLKNGFGCPKSLSQPAEILFLV